MADDLTTDHRPPATFISAFNIYRVTCTGCKQSMQPQPGVTVYDESNIPAAAAMVHRASGVICPDMVLTVGFQEMLIDSRLLPATEAEVVGQGSSSIN